MTLAQISAVLGLLLAFGVPQTEVNNVQTILEAQSLPIVTVYQPASVSSPIPESVSAATSDCVPIPSLTLSQQVSHDRPYFEAVYKTGCPIPVTTSFSSNFQDADGLDLGGDVSEQIYKNDGIPVTAPAYASDWEYYSLPNYTPCSPKADDCRSDAVLPVYYVFTIGGITQKLVVTNQ